MIKGSGFRVQGLGFKVQGYGGGFAANIYGAMPEGSIQVTSHQSPIAPNPSFLHAQGYGKIKT